MKVPFLAPVYYSLKESFWFLPAVMALASAAGAIGSVALDRHLGSAWVRGIALVWSGGADGARSVLTVIAGSNMTVVSIVFSITITALAQTSSHFGPRVLRNFTSDRRNQFVLGTFVAAFLFSLLVLRTVRSTDEGSFVPYLSVNIGIALALLALAVLIFFIHHIATSIQADLLIARIGKECREAVARTFPQTLGQAAPMDADETHEVRVQPGDPVASDGVGYVQGIDEDALFKAACAADVLITVVARPGDFVTNGQTLVIAAPRGRLREPHIRSIRRAVHVGERRTPQQDIAYAFQQLVEIAGRALSPGVNEPFTALLCIDHIGAALHLLADREMPPSLRADRTGTLRVAAEPLTFPAVVDLSIGMVRRYAGSDADVYLALLKMLRTLAAPLRRKEDREALVSEARQIAHDALDIRNPSDRRRVLDCAREVQRELRRAQSGTTDAALRPQERG